MTNQATPASRPTDANRCQPGSDVQRPRARTTRAASRAVASAPTTTSAAPPPATGPEPASRPTTTIGVPIAIPSTASAALRRGTIRPPRTVGRKWSSVATMTSDTNPMTLVHAWAGRSCPQRSRIGAQPARNSMPSTHPTATFASASV